MSSHSNRAENLLLAYYGDDVTGSTDALESAAVAGLKAVLFLAPPSPEQLKRYPGVRVVGVAGTSRSRSPDWMDAHLPDVFAKLKALGAPIIHYKTCSTFDSAPQVGSIGRAIDIAIDCFGAPVPVVVGVTRLRRYVVFSNLFAAASVAGTEDIHRIDRHPTMSRHPVTPMTEADLRRHLAKQTARTIAGFDFLQILAPDARQRLAAQSADIVVFDTFDAATTRRTGELLATSAAEKQLFVAGSSGVEYALFDHWQAEGRISGTAAALPCTPADRIVAAYGSCSPVSEAQIAWAENNGFAVITADAAALVTQRDGSEAGMIAAIGEGLAHRKGAVLCTARGPSDPRIAATRQALEAAGIGPHDSARLLGEALGRILRNVIENSGVKRAVLAGGDSSSHAITQLGIEALSVSAQLVPGAPLCRVHTDNQRLNGLEIVLKGGQVGGPDFLGRLLNGH